MIKNMHPTDPSFGRILEMGLNLTTEALKLGLSVSQPIRMTVNASYGAPGAIPMQQAFIVSFAQPTPSKYDAECWVNPLNKRIFKSEPSTQVWQLVLTWKDLFTTNDVLAAPPDQGTPPIGQPVNTLLELLAIDTSNIPDKTMYYVEEERVIYAFDLEGDAPVSETVKKPNTGPGRWYQLTTTSSLGNIDGGTF